MPAWSAHDFVPIPIVITVSDTDWKNNKDLKQRFAIALAEGKNPFEAGCLVFGKETNKALWVSTNWINDPIVTETKEEVDEIKDVPTKLLDKSEFAAKLLDIAEEKIIYNGNEVFALDGKDRIAALKLYAEAMGFINNKTEINNFNNNDNRKQFMEIKFVEPDKKEKEIKTIDATPIEPENILEHSPVKLKLVG